MTDSIAINLRPVRTLETELRILSKLRDRLGGACNEHVRCCPMGISYELYSRILWECVDCIEMFKLIVDLEERRRRHNRIYAEGRFSAPCPCCLAPEVALARLDERIEELERQMGE